MKDEYHPCLLINKQIELINPAPGQYGHEDNGQRAGWVKHDEIKIITNLLKTRIIRTHLYIFYCQPAWTSISSNLIWKANLVN